jgi:hypothetical protein
MHKVQFNLEDMFIEGQNTTLFKKGGGVGIDGLLEMMQIAFFLK